MLFNKKHVRYGFKRLFRTDGGVKFLLSGGVGGARDGVGSVRTRKEPGEAGGASHAVGLAGYLVGAVDGGEILGGLGFEIFVVVYTFEVSVVIGRCVNASRIRISIGLFTSKVVSFLSIGFWKVLF